MPPETVHTFFDKLCRDEYYTNSRLREDVLNLCFSFPECTEEIDATVMMGSGIAYNLFKAIRAAHRDGEEISYQGLFSRLDIGGDGTAESFLNAIVGRDINAMAVMQLIGCRSKDQYFEYGYEVLKWRVDNDVVH